MSEHKAVLLSQAQADLKTIASNDERRGGLQYLHATAKFVEASNGHIILRVPHDGISADEFPAIKGAGAGLNGESVLLDPKVLEKAVKNIEKKGSFPVLAYVHLSLGEKSEPLLSTTDLDTQVTVRQRKAEETYPDVSQLWLQKRRYVFALGAVELGRIVDWAIKHGGNGKTGQSIRFFTEDSTKGVFVQIQRPDFGNTAEGIIMPVRDSLSSKEEKETAEALKALQQAAALGGGGGANAN